MMNESTPAIVEGEVSCYYTLTCDWRIGAQDFSDDWHRGNTLLDALALEHGLVPYGGGTGMGRRDLEFGIPTAFVEEQFEALEAALRGIDLPDFQWSTYKPEPEDDDDTPDPLELSDEACDKLLAAIREVDTDDA